MRGNVRKDNWKRHLDWFERELEPTLDEELRKAFYEALDQAPDLRTQYDTLADRIGSRRKHLSEEMRRERDHLIGELRRLLARSIIQPSRSAQGDV